MVAKRERRPHHHGNDDDALQGVAAFEREQRCCQAHWDQYTEDDIRE